MIKENNNNGWSQAFLIVMGILWVSAMVAGFMVLEREEFTPVASTQVVASFPPDSAIQLASDKPTLVMFLHPYCPCSRASLHELDELLAETQNKVSMTIVFTIPKGIEPGWEQGVLWKSAAALPGVRIMRDEGGVEALRFGVKGSGHTLLYDASGRLLFSGGITPSRGHEGDSEGRSAIVDFVHNGHASVSHTPVFGCSLL